MPSNQPAVALRRHAARAAVALVAAAVTVAFAAPASAAEPDGGTAAGWLAAQADGPHFGEPGVTADAVMAFVAADSASAATKSAIEWLDDPAVIEPYIGTGADRSAAKVAKILLAAKAAGADAKLGGVDLEKELRALEGDDGLFTGGFTSVLGQSLAVLSLERTSAGVSSKAVEALEKGQCADGSFKFTFGSCDDANAPGDVDATGYAASALLAVGGGSASDNALDWLESQQKGNGSFVAGYPGAPENTNSTAMAAQALNSGKRDAAAEKARGFISSLQNGCDASEKDRGGVAYDASGFDPDNAVMATVQAVPALTGEGLAELDASDDKTDVPTLDCSNGGDGDGDGDGNGDGSGSDGDSAGQLPVTGNSLTLPIALGGAAVLAGGALVYLSRRNRAGKQSS